MTAPGDLASPLQVPTDSSRGGEVVLVNGQPGAAASPLDRGLHFGDGLFETIACRDGRARFLALHMERLVDGCARLRIRLQEVEAVRREVEHLARGADRAIVKLIVTRGLALARGYGLRGDETPTRITIRYPWPEEEDACWHHGVPVHKLALRLGENARLAGLKHCNRLEQVLARAELADRAKVSERTEVSDGTEVSDRTEAPARTEASKRIQPSHHGVSEGLLFSSSGRLVSGTMTNVFIVRTSSLLTPRIDLCGVAGVMRRVVLREAMRAGIPTQECPLTGTDLATAEEVFLTNARVGIWPVRLLDGRILAPGPVTRRLQDALAPLLDAPSDA